MSLSQQQELYPVLMRRPTLYSVPRNYFDESEGRTLIAVARYRATDSKRRIGTLFINAGWSLPSTAPASSHFI